LDLVNGEKTLSWVFLKMMLFGITSQKS
jgi:hypothetical protein